MQLRPVRIVLAAILAAGVSFPTLADKAPTPADDVTVTRLDNGLTVILKRIDTAPVVSVRAYVRAGGMLEKEWLGCGLSHLLEHLVAQESIHETVGGGRPHGGPPPKRSRTLEIGGQSNAYTTMDHTCYYISASSTKTMECIDLIADQMARPAFTQSDFEREHQVVQRELEMGKDDPSRQMWYAHAANVFRVHPASVPVIGHAKPLSKVTWEDIQAYHNRMYVPQNMVFVVVGQIDKAEALAKIRDEFEGFEKGRDPDLTLPDVPVLSGTREVDTPHPALKDVVGSISFQTIPLLHEDLYALDVLSYILSRGRNSRLHQRLILGKQALSVSTSSWTPSWGTGIFTVRYRAKPEKVPEVEEAIYEELQRVIDDGVSQEELARSKRQKLAEVVYDQQTAESLAGMLASDYLSTGNLRFSTDYVRGIQDVTVEQVHEMARKYFTFSDKVITRLTPPGGAIVKRADQTETEQAGGRMVRLENGLRVVLHPTDAVGLVSMALTTTGGVLPETPANNGVGSMMMAASTRGAGGRTADEIAALFDSAGGSISGDCGNNTFYWQATVLQDSFEPALRVLADVALRPDFPAKEIEVLRPLMLTRIQQTRESWLGNAQLEFRKAFFGDQTYGLLPMGRAEVVGSLTREDLVRWHKGHILAGQSVLAVYGNFDAAEAERLIRDAFEPMPPGKVDMRRAYENGRKFAVHGVREVVSKPDQKQAAIIVAVEGMRLENLDDRLAIDVLDTIMSGYRLPSGWLHTQLRGEGLVYVVHAYNWAGLARGAFMAYAGCEPDKAPRVLEVMKEKFDKAADYTPTEKEVRQAVNIILTADVLSNQTMSSLAMSAALDELYGFGYDFAKRKPELYGRITPEDVRRVGRKYFADGVFSLITTPDPSALAEPKATKTPASP